MVETSFVYGNRNAHRRDLLAEGLLGCSTDPALKKLKDEVRLSVPCYLE